MKKDTENNAPNAESGSGNREEFFVDSSPSATHNHSNNSKEGPGFLGKTIAENQSSRVNEIQPLQSSLNVSAASPYPGNKPFEKHVEDDTLHYNCGQIAALETQTKLGPAEDRLTFESFKANCVSLNCHDHQQNEYDDWSLLSAIDKAEESGHQGHNGGSCPHSHSAASEISELSGKDENKDGISCTNTGSETNCNTSSNSPLTVPIQSVHLHPAIATARNGSDVESSEEQVVSEKTSAANVEHADNEACMPQGSEKIGTDDSSPGGAVLMSSKHSVYADSSGNRVNGNCSDEHVISEKNLPAKIKNGEDRTCFHPLSESSKESNSPNSVSTNLKASVHSDICVDKTVVNHSDKPVLSEEWEKPEEERDPFDLSSEEDSYSQPKRYQPIKRKLKSPASAPEPNDVCLSVTPVDNSLENQEAEEPEVKRPRPVGRVAYVHSDELLQRVNKLFRIEGRAELVHSLVQAFGLLQYIDVVMPRAATESEILGFHSADYIDFLREISAVSDVEEETADPGKLFAEAEGYGLSYDCPLQEGIYDTASLISGASIVAADTLTSGQADIAVNWYGGWHHAKRDSASGFCYINDIVLAVLKLREKFDKVLYIDIDLHHGDGVEEAFSMTSKVMTVSFHKYAAGFFPGSGALESIGSSRGKFYSVNVPLQDGIKDAEFCSVFFRVMKMVRDQFSPEAVVLQCGADGLAGDPMASFNLTHIGLAKCVCSILAWGLPTLLLGGGGYNFPSTAKAWTFLTALVARRKLPLEIPEHENLLAYGPDYEMTTSVGNRRDCNTKEFIDNLLARISHNLKNI